MRNLIIASATLIVLFFASCSSSEKPETTGADTGTVIKAATVYTCPMHPEILSDKPGTCPVCNMDLVEKTDAASPADSAAADTGSHDGHQH